MFEECLGKNLVEFERAQMIIAALEDHDFFNERFDGRPKPKVFSDYVISEFFRAADRISNSPLGEVERYWQTSQRFKTPFFLPQITIEERCQFNSAELKDPVDALCFLLPMLCMKPSDFSFKLIRMRYADWENDPTDGKEVAVKRILEIAKEEGYKVQAVAEAIKAVKEEMGVSW
jgi:hypothetical protein